ncbi:hypothetical protein [Parvularcula marina]|uniref:Uncharacterized protein n=1 Tax=Parvularcula marina TaxID=2292771 RepID=A0A371RFA8_9PROT|nr:hypothetical protein [Parvularcula marina]RFB04134.1 hypothetical protein DX908_01865 [Parvularcula marina]
MTIEIEVFGPDYKETLPFEALPRMGEQVAFKNDQGGWERYVVTEVAHYPDHGEFQASIKIARKL